jgi:hypothetical protein
MWGLWKQTLDPEDRYDAVGLIGERVGPDLRGADSRVAPGFPARLREALRYWFRAARHSYVKSDRELQKVEVALYELAVERFGVRKSFLEWRPRLSLDQWSPYGPDPRAPVGSGICLEPGPGEPQPRKNRPEWAVRVETVDAGAWAKLRDGQLIRPRGWVGD